MNIAILIPSLNPTDKLIDITKELIKDDLCNIIIIDDGSDIEHKKIYEFLPKQVKVIYNNKNKGKGYSLKRGIKELHDVDAFITMDNDGQHSIKDVVKISKLLQKHDIVFGQRNFNLKSVPLKSKIGNKFSSFMFKLTTGKTCKDTQTGLRGINIKYKNIALESLGDRFEYEYNFLLDIIKNKIDIKYVEIDTIYENNNKDTNFRTIKDSYLIYKKYFLSILLIILLILILVLIF